MAQGKSGVYHANCANVDGAGDVKYTTEGPMAWWNRAKEPSESTSVDPNLPLIRLEGVTKRFAGDTDDTETFALNDVTVDIDRGEYISVSGPSGCGKSTFLSILALLDTPSAGRYYFNGRRMDQLSPGDKARVRNVDVGLIFQSFNLIGDMTVYENVEYPLTLRGVSSEERGGGAGGRRRGAGTGRPRGSGEAASGLALRRTPAARRDCPRHRRAAADRP